MPAYDYTWVTEPPIEVHKGQLAQDLARIGGRRLKRYIQSYRQDLKTLGDIKDPPDMLINCEDFRSLDANNVKNAESMCETFESIEKILAGNWFRVLRRALPG